MILAIRAESTVRYLGISTWRRSALSTSLAGLPLVRAQTRRIL
jgi:hypothetical protein